MVCGAAGDMLLGACVDAGLKVSDLEKELQGLGLPGWSLRARKVRKGSIGATKVDVVIRGRTEFEAMEAERGAEAHGHVHAPGSGEVGAGHHAHARPRRAAARSRSHDHGMSLDRILRLIARAKLPPPVRERAAAAFLTLGRAEARVHRRKLSDVHFHEVGAVDSIVDLTGGVLALHRLGVERVVATPFPISHGRIRCAHGTLPVPGPATLEILKGAPTEPLDVEGETLTPTGAALIRTLADSHGPMPAMTVRATGYGAGDRDFPGRPNVLRLVLGDAGGGDQDEVWQLETNLDHVAPELVGYAMDRCFAAGALDAWIVPAHMKKNRPGAVLSALVAPSDLAAVERVMFRETRTLGIRRWRTLRRKLPRSIETVVTPYGRIRLKVHDGRTARPEFEDCRRAAESKDVPLATVYESALAARTPRRSRT